MEATAYTPVDESSWNEFVAQSRNGTFLFDRGYMDYHSDRFADASAVVREKGRIVALFPASRNGSTVSSHGGLTYGGMVYSSAGTAAIIEAFDTVVAHYAAGGCTELIYKTIPSIYHRSPADDDRYMLFLRDAQLVRRDILSVIDYRGRMAMQERRARSLKKARASGLEVIESNDFTPFWTILTQNLQERYGVAPVHSLAEISMLAERFPRNIRLFLSRRDGEVLAGAVVFISPMVCHVQYNAASAAGKDHGALDVILDDLVRMFEPEVRYFDFGISTEQGGRYMNKGLVEYKEGFGSRSVVHDFYSLRLDKAGKP